MGENRELPPLRIRPRPSRILAIFLLATHGVALSVAGVLPLDWYWRIGLAILVFTSLGNVIGTRVLFLIPWAGREAIWEPISHSTMWIFKTGRRSTKSAPAVMGR